MSDQKKPSLLIEKMDFARVKQEERAFTSNLNSVLQNLNQAEALGIWCFLSSLPHNWKINKNHLQKHFNIGRDRLDKSLKLLKDSNLIEIKRLRDADGTLKDGIIVVKVGWGFNQSPEIQCIGYESPSNKGSHLSPEKPEPGLPVTGKHPLQKKDIKNKIIKTKKTKSFCKIEHQKSQNKKRHLFADAMDKKSKSIFQNPKLNEFKKFRLATSGVRANELVEEEMKKIKHKKKSLVKIT